MNSNLRRLSKSMPASSTLEKFLKSKKNLSKAPPKLWPDDPKPSLPPLDQQGLPILTLNQPILQKLESCTRIQGFHQIHAQLIVSGLFQHPLAASRVMKLLCSSLGHVSHAIVVFECIDEPDAFLCNMILRGFLDLDDPFGALGFYYNKMVGKGVECNHYTYPLLGKVYAEIGSVREGAKIHSLVLKNGFETDLFVRNSLIHMYSACRRVGDARKVFDGGSVLDLVSWNSMIDGYMKNGEANIALDLFNEMPERDVFSWNSMLSGYVGRGDMEAARVLFENMPVMDAVSWNCMIDGYATTGNLLLATKYFDRMPKRNIVSWNILLASYVRLKDYIGCLRLFQRMIARGECKPNEASLVSILTACANLGRLDMGEWIHSYVRSHGIKSDVLLSTSLLTMYAKCGAMHMARDVFNEMPEKSIVSWNSLIAGYGMHGQGGKALEMFLEMEKSGVVPNDATFVCVLSACAHANLVLEGWWFFDLMCRVYNIEPKVEHYGCMVDLLGQAGLTKDSEQLMMKMPMEGRSSLWGSLLSCWMHSNAELGKILAKHLLESQPDDIGPYVLLSKIYALEGNWDEVENVRGMIKEKGLQKRAVSGFVDDGAASMSSSRNNSSYRRRMMYSMLSEIGTELKMSCCSR